MATSRSSAAHDLMARSRLRLLGEGAPHELLQAIRPVLAGFEVPDDPVGRLLLPALQELRAKIGDVPEVPVEAAARHLQAVGHRPDLQGVGAVLRERGKAVADPVGLGEAIGHGPTIHKCIDGGHAGRHTDHTEVYGHELAGRFPGHGRADRRRHGGDPRRADAASHGQADRGADGVGSSDLRPGQAADAAAHAFQHDRLAGSAALP